MRVLYFTIVPLTSEDNGGNICCRTHIRRLAQDPLIELSVLAVGKPDWEGPTAAFLAEHSVSFRFVALKPLDVRPEGDTFSDLARFVWTVSLQTPWDLPAMNQGHVSAAIDQMIRDADIEVLVIDYTASALYLRLPRTDVKTCLVKLNREGDFYQDLITRNAVRHSPWTRSLSVARWRRLEKRLDSLVDQVVTIGPPDLPTHTTRRPAVCITPFIERKPSRWVCGETSRAFFIGNVAHYPNWMAVEWIATRLAPRLLDSRPNVTFEIIGAAEEQVPVPWRGANVLYRGVADRAVATAAFLGADCMLCPVDNDFGLKFKAAEALAFGTPLFASDATLLGLPYLARSPALHLDDPGAAADLLSSYLGHGSKLNELSADQARRHEEFVAAQSGIWGRTLGPLTGTPG